MIVNPRNYQKFDADDVDAYVTENFVAKGVFGRDPDDRPVPTIQLPDGADPHTSNDIRKRRALLGEFDAYGIARPEGLVHALALYDVGTKELRADPAIPTISGLSVEEAREVIDDYLLVRAKAEHASKARRVFATQTYKLVVGACHDAVDVVLPVVAKPYSKAAKQLTELYPEVRSIRTPAQAAELDDTGQLVGKFATAKKNVEELDRIVDFVLGLVHSDSMTNNPRNETSTARPLAVSGIGDPDAVIDVANAVEWRSGRPRRKDYPWSSFGPILEVGGTLVLPKSLSELREREDDFSG